MYMYIFMCTCSWFVFMQGCYLWFLAFPLLMLLTVPFVPYLRHKVRTSDTTETAIANALILLVPHNSIPPYNSIDRLRFSVPTPHATNCSIRPLLKTQSTY